MVIIMEENRGIHENRGVHKVYLNGRRTAVMSGVRDVLSFDAREVYLETEQGILLIKGDELHVNRLSLEKGEVDVDGIRRKGRHRFWGECFSERDYQRADLLSTNSSVYRYVFDDRV